MTAMTALPLGETSLISAAEQSAFGTPISGTGFKSINYYEAPFSYDRPMVPGKTLGAGFNNAVDARPVEPGLITGKGSIKAPMDLTQLGFFLKAAFGAPSTAGTTNYTHTFASGGAANPVYTFDIQKKSGLFDQPQDAFLRSLELMFDASQAGWSMINSDWGFSEMAESQNASVAGTPTAYGAAVLLPSYVGQFNVGGSQVGNTVKASFKESIEFEEDRFAGGGAAIGLVGIKKRTFEINATVRYTDDAIRASGLVSASDGRPTIDTGVSLIWSVGTNDKLTLTFPAARFEPIAAPINGPGGMQVDLKCLLEQTSAAAAVSAVLKNQQASY